MNKKIFWLFISCMLMTAGLYAQSSEYIFEDEEEVIITVQPQDTVVETVKLIPVTQRTWETLEQDLKNQVVNLSKGYTNKKVAKEDVVWIYEIRNVPTTTGDRTIYLNMLARGGFLLSKENPNNVMEICECYLPLSLPSEVIAKPGKYQTDDDYFGQASTNGNNKSIQNDLW